MGDAEQTRVIFRTWARKPFKGDVVAVFPDIPGAPGYVMTYAHIGQHGDGDYGHILAQSRPATAAESAKLHAELTRIGYNVRIAFRR